MSLGSLVLTVVWQTDRQTDRHTTHSDGHVIWITCVDSCMTDRQTDRQTYNSLWWPCHLDHLCWQLYDTQTDILLTLMAMSLGSLVLTVVWQTDRQTYNSLWWPCHLDHLCWQLYDRQTDRHTTHSDGQVIWITCVDSCMTDRQTDRHTTHSDGHVIWITCVDSCMRHTQTYYLLWWPCHLDHLCWQLYEWVNWLFNVTINDISVIYVTAHRCAGGLKKKLDLRFR